MEIITVYVREGINLSMPFGALRNVTVGKVISWYQPINTIGYTLMVEMERTGQICDLNSTISEVGIKNGDVLKMIKVEDNV